jgi:hypothetical protein
MQRCQALSRRARGAYHLALLMSTPTYMCLTITAHFSFISDTPPAIQDVSNAQPLRLSQHGGSIRFDNVHFSYPDGNPVLQGLTFEVPAGRYTEKLQNVVSTQTQMLLVHCLIVLQFFINCTAAATARCVPVRHVP